MGDESSEGLAGEAEKRAKDNEVGQHWLFLAVGPRPRQGKLAIELTCGPHETLSWP